MLDQRERERLVRGEQACHSSCCNHSSSAESFCLWDLCPCVTGLAWPGLILWSRSLWLKYLLYHTCTHTVRLLLTCLSVSLNLTNTGNNNCERRVRREWRREANRVEWVYVCGSCRLCCWSEALPAAVCVWGGVVRAWLSCSAQLGTTQNTTTSCSCVSWHSLLFLFWKTLHNAPFI